jgi:CBS domain-containing protein
VADRKIPWDDKIVALKLPRPICVPPSASIREVIHLIQKGSSIGALLITEGDQITGILTERDFLMRIVAHNVSYNDPVSKYMTPRPRTLSTDRPILEAIQIMNEGNFRHMPIVDPKGKPVALLGIRDLIQYFAEAFPEAVLNLPPRPHQTMGTPEGG